MILIADELYYEVHTDITGHQIHYRIINFPNSSQHAILDSMDNLNTSLGSSIDPIIIVSFMQVNWLDVCLELAKPGEFCLKNVPPGWLIVLNAFGKTYEYHTDHNGILIRSAYRFGSTG
jgi:hypothetical protein